ncbi:MAG: helix-turn-helix domain-containing protein [Thermoleophilia bacterium]|nr:helix-turn-helix domain-containing protein [Thermoleophilia bacterium]
MLNSVPESGDGGSEVASSGAAPLDTLLGGLFWGDNVVWEVSAVEAAAPFYAAAAAASGYDGRIYVRVSEREPTDPSLDVIDARPGRPHAAPAPLLRALAERCESGRNLLLIDGLDAMIVNWGAPLAEQFFARCCPQLLELGAVAYWTLPPGDAYPQLRRTVEEVTQCIFALGDDRLRVVKAEGRPPGIEGSVFRLQAVDGGVSLAPAPVAARIGTALRAARMKRHLSQSDVARLAGVSPSAISQAERGQRGLSLETLLELATKLNITLDELLRGEVAAGYRLGRRHYSGRRAAEGAAPIALLDDPEVGLRAYLVRLPPRATIDPHLTHKGLEIVAVASGLVQVVLATGRPVLRSGEVLLAEDTPVTGWRNVGPGDAAVFWILRDARRTAE